MNWVSSAALSAQFAGGTAVLAKSGAKYVAGSSRANLPSPPKVPDIDLCRT